MSSYTESPASAEFAAARQRRMQTVLRMNGVLTRSALIELSHAGSWSHDFDVVLEHAIASGRVRRLSDQLFEAGTAD